MQRKCLRGPRTPLAARFLLLVTFVGLCRPATADTIFQADGAANLGYAETNRPGSSRAYAEVSPALLLQLSSPRVTWRTGYLFAGALDLTGDRAGSYSNQLSLALAAELTSRSALLVSGSVVQGRPEFHLTQKSADAGQPTFRSATNPDLVTANLSEAYVRQMSPRVRLGQGLTGTATAPQNALGQYNATVTGFLSLSRERRNEEGQATRDALGGELRSTFSVLREPGAIDEPFYEISNALVAHWNHDFDPFWNAEATAGVEQVLKMAGSYPLAIVPHGGLTARYTTRTAGGAVGVQYGAATDLLTGTVSLNQGVFLRVFKSFDAVLPRHLAASAGFVHAQPLGEASSRVAAGIGNAAQGDVGLLWGLSDAIIATARYSVAYQFDQPAGLMPLLTQVVVVGITMRYSNARYVPPIPTPGERVDGSDRVGFPESGSSKR